MKKVMFLMAVAGMFAFAACNNTPATEEPAADTTEMECTAEEPTCCDTTAAEVAAEEVVETPAAE
ncbi:MAG: hypothetical protein J6X88_08460 [Bacteroidales bacterium]|nr:hypothetical protein [Bacteroidales bacterium]